MHSYLAGSVTVAVTVNTFDGKQIYARRLSFYTCRFFVIVNISVRRKLMGSSGENKRLGILALVANGLLQVTMINLLGCAEGSLRGYNKKLLDITWLVFLFLQSSVELN